MARDGIARNCARSAALAFATTAFCSLNMLIKMYVCPGSPRCLFTGMVVQAPIPWPIRGPVCVRERSWRSIEVKHTKITDWRGALASYP